MLQSDYKSRISGLSKVKQQLLVYCIVERYHQLVIDYDAFYEEDMYKLFSIKLKEAFNMMLNGSLDAKYLEESLPIILEAIPQSEDRPEAECALFSNAMAVLYYYYDLLITDNSENTFFVFNALFETVNLIKYISDSNYIFKDDYKKEVQKENIVLDKFLNILDSYDTITGETIEKMKDVALKNTFISNPTIN